MDPPRVVGELRADLAGPVAQGDHVVERAAGEGVQVPGALAGDVDAERLAQHPDGVGVQVAAWAGSRRWSRSRGRRCGGAAVLRRSVSGRCCRCTRTARRCVGTAAVRPGDRWCGDPAQRRVQRGAAVGQRIRAAVQVQVVVAVAAVEAAARGGDQPAVAQQPQVVGDQVLRLVDPCHQLADPVVAVGEFGQQLPAQRVGGQPDERRWGGDVPAGDMTSDATSSAIDASSQFDVPVHL